MTVINADMYVKALAIALTAVLIGAFVYPYVEPQLVRAQASDTITVTLNVDSGITISDEANVTMTPDISLTTDGSTGDVTWTVETNDLNGYSLDVRAGSDPAMQHTTEPDNFADFSDNGNAWSVASGNKEFGYSATGDDVEAEFGSGSCPTGDDPSSTGTLNWRGFTTSDYTIASNSGTTSASGNTTTVCFGAEQVDTFASSGEYQATVTATATTN